MNDQFPEQRDTSFEEESSDDDLMFYQPYQKNSIRRRNAKSLRKWLVIGGLTAAFGVAVVGGGGALAVVHANPFSSPGSTSTIAPSNRMPGSPRGMRGRGELLTVSSVSNGVIVAKDPSGASVTIKTTTTTTYTRAGKTVTASAIASGEHIHVRGARNSDGSISATQVDIVLPGYFGAVTAVGSNTITVQDRNGSHIINISSSTTIESAGQTISLSGVKVGDRVAAEGSLNSDGSLNAEAIHVSLPQAGGQITKISGNTITVKDPRGSTHTIVVSSATKFYSGATQTQLSALKTGEFIMAEGSQTSNGTLNAVEVRVAPAHPDGPNGPDDHLGPQGGPNGMPFAPPSNGSTSGANA